MTISISPAQINDPLFASQYESQIDQAILSTPENPDLYILKSVCLLHTGKYEEALKYAKKGVGADPNNLTSYVTLASCYHHLGELEEEYNTYAYAYSKCNHIPSINWNFSHVLLRRGSDQLGWTLYDWRKVHLPNHTRFRQPDITQTLLKGGTLFVHAEQGLGDQIQFLRYIPTLKKYFDKIIYESSSELYHLVSDNADSLGIDYVICRSKDFSVNVKFDHHCSVMDIPLYFVKVSVYPEDFKENMYGSLPNWVKEIRKSVIEEWDKSLFSNFKSSNQKTVGLNWRGSPNHPNDKNRSIPHPDIFKPLSDNVLISLDLGEPVKTDYMLYNVRDGLPNVAYTAAFIKNLDVVVTVDSMIAHLAGSMGKKCIMMLPYLSEWRWGLNDTITPLYPSITMVRQGPDRKWEPVVDKVKEIIDHEI